MRKLINGLSTNLFSLFLIIFGVKKTEKYSTTLDDGYVLKEIPNAYPAVDSIRSVATDLGDFQVVSIDEESSIITIRECKSDLEFQVNVDVFDLIFVAPVIKTDTQA